MNILLGRGTREDLLTVCSLGGSRSGSPSAELPEVLLSPSHYVNLVVFVAVLACELLLAL